MFTATLRDQPKVREIQPMQKRVGLWRPKNMEVCLVEISSEVHSSPRIESPKPIQEIEIPFSKNRYGDEIDHDELQHENQKKAIQFLKKQKKSKTKKDNERKKLIERKKEYQEKIRKINKVKLHKQRKRNSSSENMNSDIKHLKQNIAIRSKSEEMRTKGIKVNRRFARERIGLGNYSDAKVEKALIRQHYNIKTISVDDEVNQHTISDN